MNTAPIKRSWRNNEVDIYMYQGATDVVEGVTSMCFDDVISHMVLKATDSVSLQIARTQYTVSNVGSGPREIEGTSLTFSPVDGVDLEGAFAVAESVDLAIKECAKVDAKIKANKEYDHEAFMHELLG